MQRRSSTELRQRVNEVNMEQYEVGSYIMHESSGVCRVKSIEERALSGKGSERLYYLLEPVFQSGSQVITPVDGAKQRIRDVITPEDVSKIESDISGLEILEAANERQMAEVYKEHIAAFEPMELARIVKTVFVRRRKRMEAGKKVMSQDEKALAVAGRKLYEEMAFVLKEPVEEVEATIAGLLSDV